jgi:predicted peptidase
MSDSRAADPEPKAAPKPAASLSFKVTLEPGASFTINFLEMPDTFYKKSTGEDVKPRMTISLPRNYDLAKKHPLFIFMTGGNGGGGSNTSIARAITEEQDFICVSVPLFKDGDPKAAGGNLFRDPDAKYMLPYFKTMLAKLESVVPNIDPKHRVLGGFSNGAHATGGLIDESDGEIARAFSAFLFVEGGGRTRHFEYLKGKPLLMVSSNTKSTPRAREICDTANAAGALGTFILQDVGAHDFPKTAYPKVREWLRGVAMGTGIEAGQK